MRPPRLWTVPAVALLAACGGAPERAPDATSSALQVTNGNQLNGNQLNGNQLNGTALGSELASVAYAGARLGGGELEGVFIAGSELRAGREDQAIGGVDLRGARFRGQSDTGVRVDLSVAWVGREPAPDDDTWLYWVQFRTSDGWRPLCRDGQGWPSPAIAVAGRWDYRRGVPGGGAKIDDPEAFTFACRGVGAIGKCISPIGYRPWRTASGKQLDRHHEACVRLIRADFCGDGTSYTRDGNRVNVYDGVGVQRDTEPLWLIEAEWDERGARCFNPLNRAHAFVPCFLDRSLSVCGNPLDFWTGALLMDETPPLSNLP